MQKIFFFLLTILSLQLQAQTVDYYPSTADNGTSIRPTAFAVLKPTNYTPLKKYDVLVMVPGMGDRSLGLLADLVNVVEGYDYDGPGPLPRQYAVATPEYKAEIQKREFIGVVTTYPNEFNPSDFNYIFDYLAANYSIDTKGQGIIGFSLGGGAVVRYITSSLANAQRVSLAIACAPVNWATVYKNVTDAKLPFLGVTNKTDPRVSPENVKTIVAGINALSPAIPAYLKIYDQDGHGSINETLADDRIYQWLTTIDADNPISYSAFITSPTTPVPPPVTPSLSAAFNIADGQVVTTSTLDMDASASTNVSTSWDGYLWGVTPITGSWAFSLQGGAYGGPKKIITGLRNGVYSIILTVKDKTGNTAQKAITVKVALDGTVTTKVPASYDGINLIFTDGTKEVATLKWDGTKFTATTATKVYTL